MTAEPREMVEQRCREMEAANERLRSALRKLRSCSHACAAPCPHTRHFDEVTKDVLPPRRVRPYPVETGRR